MIDGRLTFIDSLDSDYVVRYYVSDVHQQNETYSKNDYTKQQVKDLAVQWLDGIRELED